MRVQFAIAFIVSVGACTAVEEEPQNPLATAVWEFVQTLPDSVCQACNRFYVHPAVAQEYDGPMIDHDGGAVMALPLLVGEEWYIDSDTLEVRTIRDAEARDGRIALAARIPKGHSSTADPNLIVEIYVSRGGRWLLEGAVVATGILNEQGWSLEFKELNWT